MRTGCALAVSLVMVVLGGSVALAKAPPAPAWCKVDGKIEQGFADNAKKDDDGPRAIIAITYLMCNPDYFQDEDVPTVQAAYKRWSARLELTDADWHDMAQFATGRGDLSLRADDDKAKWSGLAPDDQYAYIMYPVVSTPGLSGETDAFYVADAFGARLSEIGRLGFIDQCLQHATKPVAMAMCQADMDAFDIKKTFAEIRTLKNPTVRAILRLIADRDRPLVAARQADVKKLIGKDDAYKKMFEIAAQVRKNWDGVAKENAEILAVQDLMDDAMVSNSRKATAGCHEKTFKALQSAISKLPAKAFSVKRIPDKEDSFPEDVMNRVVEIVIGNPGGFLAASAYTECEQLDPEKEGASDNLANTFSTTLSRWGGFRGPRSATYTAILLANLQLDDRSQGIDFPRLERIWFKQSNPKGGGNASAIDSVKVKGDVATVAYSQKMVKETVDTGCSRSNHVVGIRGDGSIEYEYNCTGSKTITYDGRPKPDDVRARYAGGLKAGNMVMVNSDIVWMAWAKPDAAVPAFVLGQAVK